MELFFLDYLIIIVAQKAAEIDLSEIATKNDTFAPNISPMNGNLHIELFWK